MVRKNHLNTRGNLVRNAFTMIELIFAIVVIAVVVLTIPMMIQVNNKALEGNVAQEAIFLVSAVLSGRTTELWDDNAIGNTFGDVSLSKILDTSNGAAAYDRVNVNSNLRAGGVNEDLHRSLFSTVITPAQTGTETTSSSTSAGDAAGYTNRYYVNETKGYIDDSVGAFAFTGTTLPAGQTTNVKMIEVVVRAAPNDGGTPVDVARLRAYTCNIGEVDYAKRRF